MKNFDLDGGLARLAARQPKPAFGFEAGVWREIAARRREERRESVFEEWVATIFRPIGALSMTAVTLAIAIGVGFVQIDAGDSVARSTPLGMGVFASDAPALPSTLLSQTR